MLNRATIGRMAMHLRTGATTLLLLSALLVGTFASAAKTPITMQEMLHTESIGLRTDAPVFSPDGKMLAFVRGIPIAEQNTWGYTFDRVVRSRVFVMPRDGATPKEIPNTQTTHYDLAPERAWSPDGRYLLLLATTHKGIGLAAYDTVDGKISAIPGYIDNVFFLFDWTRDDRIVYFTVPRDAPQLGDHRVLATTEKRWKAAWFGDTPQATVSSHSPVFKTSEPPAGALMLFDLRHGTSRKLATGNYSGISVSPDGSHVAAVRTAEFLPNSLSTDNHRGELQIFRLAANDTATLVHRYRKLDVVASNVFPRGLAWSRSGAHLLVVGRPAASRPITRTYLYEVDANGGKPQRLASPGLSFVNPHAGSALQTLQLGWIGEEPIAVASRTTESLQRAPDQTKSHLSYGKARNQRFDVYAFHAGHTENITAFASKSVNQFVLPQSGEYAMAVADDALWKIAPGSEPTRLSPKNAPKIVAFATEHIYPTPSSAYYRSGSHERVGLTVLNSQSSPERAVLYLQSGKLIPLQVRGEIVATAPDQLATISKVHDGWTSSLLLNDAGSTRTLLAINGKLKNKAVAPVKPFRFSYKGKPLRGWVVLPPNAKPGWPLPAVVSVYGGMVWGDEPPFEAKAEIFLPQFSGQLLAAQGYAVIYPSVPLGPGATTDVMATLAGETVAAVDALAAKGIVDPDRVGVMGQSFGGFSTAAILAKRSDRFKAGISMAGIYGWVAASGMPPMAQMLGNDGHIYGVNPVSKQGQIQLRQPFWEAPRAYMRNSPIFHVKSINAPLLLLHGDLDLGATGLPLAMRMYNAMVRAGKTVALVHYWGQGHVADSASAIRDQWSRITAWFGYYLKGERTKASKASTRSRPTSRPPAARHPAVCGGHAQHATARHSDAERAA